ncbi:phosphoglycerate mutase [Abditibacterium utsteinense]|uniref:2,3-bisphosphoglycerate-independent phosphoglycerate mutase n=1 Tax=Abditibacterium utsteinense TaxID=1960156 RepID=A0A2S8STP5_9BACT|nr:2,3-bisphosphoglycerate-independent phosphoglycerate mutase [Abditibacterium utsteinense]PQV64175.1 phosphoglycerate mutase [Abditibacterium utsteinense]
MPTPRPVMLAILDGYGLSDNPVANAVALAQNPNFKRLWNDFPHTQLTAHGTDVGLPPGVMGNSEVGHLNIGAGRIVFQDSSLIDNSIATGDFFGNETLLEAISKVKTANSRLHLIGLTSNGNVHASEGHYFALLEMAARHDLLGDKVCFHAFTDGRDTPPDSGIGYVSRLLEQMMKTGVGCVASIVGRYYAMDRDKRWPRVKLAYECLTSGIGHQSPDAISALKSAYARGETDEFVGATVILDESGNPRPRIQSGDAVVFFNYRSDRGRELMQVFLDPTFDQNLPANPEDHERAPFVRKVRPEVFFASMTRYSENQSAPYAFGPRPQRDGLGETLGKAGKTQLRVAETEKYPHVTFFFSGGMETPWPGEERILVNSPDVATYDLQPEMSAPEVTEKVVSAILSQKFDAIILNFAQTDMVGHTGSLEAAIKSVESADAGLGEVMRAIEEVGGALLVIADHGNVEQMLDYKTGKPHTAHTTNPVPCILFGAGFENAKLRNGGRLADIAPTLLDLMGLEKPAAMTGVSLLGESKKQVEATRPNAIAQSFGAQLQKSVAGRVNPALSRSEVVAALREGETRLIYVCENQSDELAAKLADSAKDRLDILI